MEYLQLQSRQMVTLNDLSDELLTIIVEGITTRYPPDHFMSGGSLLTGHTSRRRLLITLATCSRRLQRIVEPVLYAKFEDVHKRSLGIFLCRIMARPDLAKRVRVFHCRAQDFHVITSKKAMDVSDITSESWVHIRAAIQVLEPDGKKTTLWDAEKGSWEALTTLVLSFLPNLQHLYFRGWDTVQLDGLESLEDECPSLASFLSRAADCQNGIQKLLSSTQSPLPHISHVFFGSFGYPEADLEDLFRFMNLKSLRNISSRNISSQHWRTRYEDCDFEGTIPDLFNSLDFSHITNISLETGIMPLSLLTFLLRCCPNLQRLRYCECHDHTENASPRFMRALQFVKSSLEELEVQLYGDAQFDVTLEYSQIGSFAAFENLKTLRISTSILLGFDLPNSLSHRRDLPLRSVLPPKLEHLAICSGQNILVDLLFELLAHTSEFPFLKKIDISWTDYPYAKRLDIPWIDFYYTGDYDTSYEYKVFYPSGIPDLRYLFKAVGVKLSQDLDRYHSRAELSFMQIPRANRAREPLDAL